MVLTNSYYFTSKSEIKPQHLGGQDSLDYNYFTSKSEIKPQHVRASRRFRCYYFTSKSEIKPQLYFYKVFS